MRRFLLHALLFGLLALAGIAGYIWHYRAYVPAPRITNNISLNAKLRMLKQRRGQPIHLLALGSSMTLNNLSSRAVLEAFHDSSYLNMGAWGTDLAQSFELAEDIVPLVRPSVVLMVTNLGDFSANAERYVVDSTRMANYLVKWSEADAYLHARDAGYYLRQMELNAVRMNDAGNYERLVFDPWGGVQLNVPKDRIDQERFDKRPPRLDELSEEQYRALERLAAYLERRHVRFILIQSPYRQGVRSVTVEADVAAHKRRVWTILAAHGHRFDDGTDALWPDSLFCDYGHLNAQGAYLFTRHALAE